MRGVGLRMGTVARSAASLACSTRTVATVPAGQETKGGRCSALSAAAQRCKPRSAVLKQNCCLAAHHTQASTHPLCGGAHGGTPAPGPAPAAGATAPLPRAGWRRNRSRGAAAVAPAGGKKRRRTAGRGGSFSMIHDQYDVISSLGEAALSSTAVHTRASCRWVTEEHSQLTSSGGSKPPTSTTHHYLWMNDERRRPLRAPGAGS